MIKYENGKIYKIIPPIADEPCYVGSTTKLYLSQRLAGHVNDYNLWKTSGNAKRKCKSIELFEKYGVENCKIILLESVNAQSKDELRIKEQEYIEKLNCVNIQRAYCSIENKKTDKKKWMNENREYITNQKKIYWANNKATLSAQKKIYWAKNKATLSAQKKIYRTENKQTLAASSRQYYEKNKATIAAKHKSYLETHKKERKIYEQKEYFCDSCNKNVKLVRKSPHNKSKLHIQNTLNHMESTLRQYKLVKPIEIEQFNL